MSRKEIACAQAPPPGIQHPPPSRGKVPAPTPGFWLAKILATTLGETFGDTVSMTLGWGYLAATALFAGLLVLLVAAQIRARRYFAPLYWATIVASTTAGTTLADFADRSLGLGYPGGTLILVAAVVASLVAWRAATGSVAIAHVSDARSERFYWLTITFAQTLGTALGDWVADAGLGYGGAAAVFAAGLGLVAIAYATGCLGATAAFWLAFVLTRPFGAALGDFLDKPLAQGGLAFSRPLASLALIVMMIVVLAIMPGRAAGRGAGMEEPFS